MDEVARVVRVAVVVGEPLDRSALAAVLAADPRLRVPHVLGGCAPARAVLAPRAVDVVVLDADLPDGPGAALAVLLQRADPRLGVLLLSAGDVPRALPRRPDGPPSPRPWSHLSRRTDGGAPALVAAVLATARGQVVLDPGPREPAGGQDARPADPLASLTAARHGVLRLAAHGLSNRAVSRLLGLSPRSVENHLAAVYRALGVDRQEVNPRVAAVLAYRRWSRTG